MTTFFGTAPLVGILFEVLRIESMEIVLETFTGKCMICF